MLDNFCCRLHLSGAHLTYKLYFHNDISDKPCELQCVPRNRNDIEILDGYVADGTPCRQTLGSRDMCIAG